MDPTLEDRLNSFEFIPYPLRAEAKVWHDYTGNLDRGNELIGQKVQHFLMIVGNGPMFIQVRTEEPKIFQVYLCVLREVF